jgi:hypothetical protein
MGCNVLIDLIKEADTIKEQSRNPISPKAFIVFEKG